MNKRTVLKNMFRDRETYFAPGVFDCIGAMAVEKAGFHTALISGNAVSASMFGLPDMGLLTMSEVTQSASHIAHSVEIPVIADADTGYGQPLNFIRTLHEFERGGIAGIHLEDQISPKKCAYYGGMHEVVPKEEYLRKLKAGIEAREDPDFCIIARTDALVSYGRETAISRANDYLEAGADAAFVVGYSSIEDVEAMARGVHGPLVVNINDTGELNRYSHEVFRQLGVKLVLYPATLRSLFLKQALETMDCLNKDGNTQQKLDSLATLTEFQKLTKVSEYEAMEYKYSK
ncbi:methylisocitrate lyase [Anaerotruncus colihominis]|uniref:Methylisocitrate lyase n=1 Tax=Anaerotruncus colihominis TaxID=169435 RepID=A0A845RBK1_9FIRM|nr:isocitrate lyase/PEP mutase family protein [Anaerotruncus colihominis]NBI77566.1 methylisocitrate lyase [Anaerotruncus colihominis]